MEKRKTNMRNLNNLFQELGISKVRLAKYLGVSRQMVYNYLELDDLNKWPKEKKLLLYKLLDIDDKTNFDNINITTDYLMAVESRLNQGVKSTNEVESYLDLKGLSKDSQELLIDITNLIREKLSDDEEGSNSYHNHENYYSFLYMYHMLQSMDNVPEIKYIFGYMSKTTGFTDPEEYKFEEDKQFTFEGILYTALTLYNNGGASRSKLQESHRHWIQELEVKKEDKLSRTQQLNSVKIQALSELGYTELNKDNAEEVLEKMAEIQSRKV
jgi:transcriptional regulator with XRE-family HTH domain